MSLHDETCENRSGGKYHGVTLSDDKGIPCHCAAREQGLQEAEREGAR